MAYTQVRYIGYQISTVGLANPTVYGIDAGAVNNPPPLTGVTGDLPADAQVRVERLIGAMLRARSQLGPSDSNQTLKVFIAPEFYFRPNNTDFAYSLSEYRAIKDVLRQTITADAGFDHWLVIPGTIIWKQTGTDTGRRKMDVSDPTHSVYFNTALYIKKSNNPKLKSSRVIEKVKASHIDGIPAKRFSGSNVNPPDVFAASEEFPKYLDRAHLDKHALKVCGLKIGVEICYEHYLQLLRAVLEGQYKGFGSAPEFDLQLLTAGGMDCMPRSIAAKVHGFVFRSDGYVDESVGEKGVELFEVSAYSVINGARTQTATATLLNVGELASREITIGATDDLYLPPPPTCTATWTTQKVVLFPTLRLP